MELNCVHRPIFPAHLAEDNLVSPMRIVNGYLVEGIPERNGEGFGRWWGGNREIEDCYDFGRDTVDHQDTSDSVYNDLLARLPSDPFGMDISTSITAAITGLFENLEVGYVNCATSSYLGTSDSDYGLFAGAVWNTASSSRSTDNTLYSYGNYEMSSYVGTSNRDYGVFADFAVWNKASTSGSTDNTPYPNQSAADRNYGLPTTIDSSFNSKISDTCCQGIHGEAFGGSCSSTDTNDGVPHEALSFALGYLGVKDLLSVEMTCRSLFYTVRNDPLLWRIIHIDKPLNERITDDSLLQLTRKAQGNLHCLSLLECTKITDDGLKRAVELNPQLKKLCVPGCTRLSIEGIVGIVKTVNHTKGSPRIRFLRIGGIYGVTHEHYETLKALIDTNESSEQKPHRPHFYVRENMYRLCDDECAIDVEECPRCQKFRLVYDCPFEGCQDKGRTSDSCRACALCILRCSQCGRCIDGIEYEENFWLELLCSVCKRQVPW